MPQGTPTGSFFPPSQAIITGGSFTVIQNVAQPSMSGPKGGYERLLDAVAPNALHDSGHDIDPPKCHPGTRVAIIETIIEWAAGLNDANRDKLFTWLTGAAGAGKSAIGRSVCERCAEEGTLLASFFFGSKDSTRNHSKSIAATIAYQICKLNPALRTAVTAAVDHDPLVFTQSLRAQLISLVMGPLSAIYANEPLKAPRLIVVDGLDECLDEASQQDVLNALFYLATTSVIPIRILVCSRQESQILTMFSATKMTPVLFKILLDKDYSSREDIKLYLCDGFQEIRETHVFRASIPSSWPTEDQVNKITYKSSGQFIYATIVVRYVKSSRHWPHQRLDTILGLRPPFKDLPFSELDALYMHLLNSTDDPPLSADIMAFLALYDNIFTADIDSFLCLETGETEAILSRLSSIVELVELCTQQGNKFSASLLHKSFGDFLFDPHRSKRFWKMPTETRAFHCIRLIQMFSEKHGQCRLTDNFNLYFSFPTILARDPDNYPHWSYSTQLAFRIAVIQFPMNLYCQEISSHSHLICADYQFLNHFLWLLVKLEENHVITAEVLNHHAYNFCNYVLSEVKGRYMDHWEMNFLFKVVYSETSIRVWLDTLTTFSWIIWRLLAYYRPIPVVNNTFHLLLTKSDEAVITSKAALYCLEYMCNCAYTKEVAKVHLRTRKIDFNRRKTHPCLWHLKASHHHLQKRLVLTVTLFNNSTKLGLTTYKRLRRDHNIGRYHMFPLYSLAWTNRTQDIIHGPRLHITESWEKYFSVWKYFIAILPHAAKFPPLIQLCKTKAFAPISMIFPDKSRLARRAIQEYLTRVDTGTVEDD